MGIGMLVWSVDPLNLNTKSNVERFLLPAMIAVRKRFAVMACNQVRSSMTDIRNGTRAEAHYSVWTMSQERRPRSPVPLYG